MSVLDLGTLYGKIGLDTGPFERALSNASRQLGAWTSSMSKDGRKGGENLGDGIYRGTDGRLRDAKTRFAAIGEGIGDNIGTGTNRGLAGAIGRARDWTARMEQKGREAGTKLSALLSEKAAQGSGKAGRDSASAFESSFNPTAVGAKIAGALGLVGIGLAAKNAIGGVLGAGYTRLESIDSAGAKLRGLGMDADTSAQVMANALASVKGTAFGMGEAAVTAAGAVAASIKPGDDLERVLKNVANAAAATDTSMADMGSIFNKVATTNKATNESLLQVADRGLPIYQKLAEQFGVTTSEVEEMASRSEINFQQFSDAAAAAAGTVADEMGTTATGRIANFRASLGRLGAAALGGVFGGIGPAFQGFTEWVDRATEAIKPFAAEFGANLVEKMQTAMAWVTDTGIPAIQGIFNLVAKGEFTDGLSQAFGVEEDSPVVGFLLGIRDAILAIPGALQEAWAWIQTNREWLEPLAAGILAVIGAVKAWQIATAAFTAVQAALNVVLSMNPIGIVVLAIIGLVAALTYAYHNSETFRNVVDNAFRKVMEIAKTVGDWFTNTLAPGFQSALKRIQDDFTMVRDWITARLNDVTNAGRAVGDFFTQTVPGKFEEAKQGIKRAFEGVTDFITSPIRKAIEWINTNFIDRFNGFLGDIGVSWQLPRIPAMQDGGTVPGLESGGVVPGQFDPMNRDNVLGVNAAGVPIVRVEPGETVISRANSQRMRSAGLLDGSGLPRFQDGGVIGAVTGALDFIKDPAGWVTGKLDSLLEGIGGGVWGAIIKSALSRIPEAIVNRVKSMVGAGFAGDAVVPPGVGVLPAAGVITSGYGFRYGPFNGAELHDGVDIGAPYGTPVRSALPGVVDYAGWMGGYGNTVGVSSGAIRMFYAHMATILASVGQLVQAGQVVGLVGSTGWSTGPHLHWGASVNGASANPLSLIGGYANGTGQTGASKGWWRVGEFGPEWINFGGHEQVIPSGGQPGQGQLHLHLESKGDLLRDLESAVFELGRKQATNLTMALGSV